MFCGEDWYRFVLARLRKKLLNRNYCLRSQYLSCHSGTFSLVCQTFRDTLEWTQVEWNTACTFVKIASRHKAPWLQILQRQVSPPRFYKTQSQNFKDGVYYTSVGSFANSSSSSIVGVFNAPASESVLTKEPPRFPWEEFITTSGIALRSSVIARCTTTDFFSPHFKV